jgi:phenylalanyl-tRNA synthetase alpha chain
MMEADESKTDTRPTPEQIETTILSYLQENEAIPDSIAFCLERKIEHPDFIGVMKSLAASSFVIETPVQTQSYELTEEGEGVISEGSAEYRLFSAIPPETGEERSTLEEMLGRDVVNIGMGPCMKNKWVRRDGDRLCRSVDEIEDEVASQLSNLSLQGVKVLKTLKKRKLIQQRQVTTFSVTKGELYAPVRGQMARDLTVEMLQSGEWAELSFKPYNFQAMGLEGRNGNLHPLLKVRSEFRRILMEMGFEEMPTNKWVESSFWNFDALFQPQSHPARDAHDTFFIADPENCESYPVDYYNRVKAVHEDGGFGSVGYRYDFKESEARKNLLRTHTTAISAQMLYQLANQEGGFSPRKYFSIDRVFRNETMDQTHLCEFHQVEGLVADYNLGLQDLMGVIQTFFEKIGITELRFKPAYNPYTEPSMEIMGYHPDLKRWTEIGNSGIFRPEMLRPMGLPEDVRVIAWGLSLERPTMIKYRINNIRELFGHKIDIKSTQDAPIARFV